MPDVAEEMEDSIDESTRHNVYSAPVPGKIVHSQLQGDIQAQSGSLDAPAYAHRYWGSVSLQQFQAEPFMGGPGEEEVDGHSQTFMGGPGDENTAINGEPFMGGPGDEIEDEQPFAGGPGDEDVGEEAGPRDYSIQEGPGDEVVKYSSEPLNGVSRRPSSDGQASDSTTHTLKADSERPTTVKHNDGSRRSQIPYLQPPTPTSAASSAIPSPDFIPPSFDEPRLLTAGSSFTDEYPYGSTRYSEIVAYETRCSVSDVPSLIGSLSSHTSGVNIATLNQLTRPSAVRSMSENLLETDQHLRPSLASHKRASLMSLTRLIHSSPSKSKLSLETSALGEDEPMRQAKRHRFSRLLQFWRTKNAA